MSGQDEPNLALWLATRASKMELSCTLGIWALSREGNLVFYPILIINYLYWPSLFGQDGWILALFFFCVSVQKHTKKELGQYQVILTSRLVNNPYCNAIHTCWRAYVYTRKMEHYKTMALVYHSEALQNQCYRSKLNSGQNYLDLVWFSISFVFQP